jgi:ABC-type amino acid transport substrate-binding protein
MSEDASATRRAGFRTAKRLFAYGTAAVIAAAALFAAAGVRLEAASPTADFKLVNPGYLTVATYGSVIPGIVVGPGDQIGGLDGVLLTAFARDHGLKLKLYQTTFASMILAVEQGKVDIGTYIFYTKERAQHVFYTYPFLVSYAVLYTLKSFPYSGPASMTGKKVGTVVGFVWAPYLQKWSASGAALFPDQVTVAQALLNGQIQGYVNGGFVIHAPPFNDTPKVVEHPLHVGDFTIPEPLLANPAYNMVNCNNHGLGAALDQELAQLRKSGEWQKTLASYHLGEEQNVALKTPAQLCGS